MNRTPSKTLIGFSLRTARNPSWNPVIFEPIPGNQRMSTSIIVKSKRRVSFVGSSKIQRGQLLRIRCVEPSRGKVILKILSRLSSVCEVNSNISEFVDLLMFVFLVFKLSSDLAEFVFSTQVRRIDVALVITAYPTCSNIFQCSKQSSKPKLVGLFSLKCGIRQRHLRALALSFVNRVGQCTGGCTFLSFLMMIALITIKSSLVPLIEGLCAQI